MNNIINTTKPQYRNIKDYLAKNNDGYSSKLDIISAICNQWSVRELKQSGIINAYLLNWNPVHFALSATIIADSISIVHQDRHYDCKIINGTLADLQQCKKVAISFRHCAELGLSIALIKLIWK